jgi:hypothetical protein
MQHHPTPPHPTPPHPTPPHPTPPHPTPPHPHAEPLTRMQLCVNTDKHAPAKLSRNSRVPALMRSPALHQCCMPSIIMSAPLPVICPLSISLTALCWLDFRNITLNIPGRRAPALPPACSFVPPGCHAGLTRPPGPHCPPALLRHHAAAPHPGPVHLQRHGAAGEQSAQ